MSPIWSCLLQAFQLIILAKLHSVTQLFFRAGVPKKLGISPINDFAFAKTFARPENNVALISLLNAILQFERPIEDVTIRNPFNYQDFSEDKLTILDIKATDTEGRIFNVEMQLSVHSGLVQRIVYYGCEVYTDQLRKGDDFSDLNPVFAICILNGVLWRENPKVHHRFRLTDQETGRILFDTIEIHMLELGWYNLAEKDLNNASSAERWIYWLLNAQQYEAEQLGSLFPEPGFQAATESLVQIHQKTEDKVMYDAREKAIRNHQWAIHSSKEAGKLEGKIEGKIELIHTLQSILLIPQTPEKELSQQTLEQLQELTAELQTKVHNR